MGKSALLLILGLVSLPLHAQRIHAELDCRFTGTDFVYDCEVRLARGGAPLAGVQLSIGADMPSMPMMHNVRPVKATPGATAGTYQARLELEMHGDWAVQLNLSGPARDRVVTILRFDPDKVAPATGARQRHKH